MPALANNAIAFALLTVAATLGLIACDAAGNRRARIILKPLAASGFLLTAWAAGANDSAYGRWILLGLAFSWVGDVALLARDSVRLFQLGLCSFLVGHVAYGIAFLARGISLSAALWTGMLASLGAVAAVLWLTPHLKVAMRFPVYAYVTVISLMVALATATVVEAGNSWILIGALLFYISDLAVARERFVKKSRWDGAWGTPTYFFGQVILALTVG